MEMIDRYVYAVTQRLPAKQRADIEMELRGLIEDMMEERRDEGGSAEEVARETLLSLGEPGELANRYRGGPRYVVPPEMLDVYLLLLKIVGSSALFGLGLVFVIRAVVDPMQALDYFIDYVVSIFSGVIPHTIGWVTLVFLILSLTGTKWEVGMNKEWTPEELPPIPDPKRRIHPSEPIAALLFTPAFLIVFFGFLHLVGLPVRAGGNPLVIVSYFEEAALHAYWPGVVALSAVVAVMNVYKLMKRRWTKRLAWANVAYQLVYFGFLALVFTDPAVFNPAFIEQLVQAGVLNEGGAGEAFWANAKQWLIYIAAPFVVWDIAQTLYRVYRT